MGLNAKTQFMQSCHVDQKMLTKHLRPAVHHLTCGAPFDRLGDLGNAFFKFIDLNGTS